MLLTLCIYLNKFVFIREKANRITTLDEQLKFFFFFLFKILIQMKISLYLRLHYFLKIFVHDSQCAFKNLYYCILL